MAREVVGGVVVQCSERQVGAFYRISQMHWAEGRCFRVHSVHKYCVRGFAPENNVMNGQSESSCTVDNILTTEMRWWLCHRVPALLFMSAPPSQNYIIATHGYIWWRYIYGTTMYPKWVRRVYCEVGEKFETGGGKINRRRGKEKEKEILKTAQK